MNLESIRAESWQTVRKLRLPWNPALPLLDEVPIRRTVSQVVGRVLVMSAAAYCFYGFDRRRALAWLKRERCLGYATDAERAFLHGDDEHAAQMYWQIEGEWVLAWALGAVKELDLTAADAPDHLAASMPGCPKDESTAAFRKRAKLRPASEVIEKCDLAYCLHWALRETALQGRRRRKPPAYEAIYERRRALEWLLCDDEWDEVPMDT